MEFINLVFPSNLKAIAHTSSNLFVEVVVAQPRSLLLENPKIPSLVSNVYFSWFTEALNLRVAF